MYIFSVWNKNIIFDEIDMIKWFYLQTNLEKKWMNMYCKLDTQIIYKIHVHGMYV